MRAEQIFDWDLRLNACLDKHFGEGGKGEVIKQMQTLCCGKDITGLTFLVEPALVLGGSAVAIARNILVVSTASGEMYTHTNGA